VNFNKENLVVIYYPVHYHYCYVQFLFSQAELLCLGQVSQMSTTEITRVSFLQDRWPSYHPTNTVSVLKHLW